MSEREGMRTETVVTNPEPILMPDEPHRTDSGRVNRSQYAIQFIERNRIIKLGETSTDVVIGVARGPAPPDRAEIIERLERFHQKPIRVEQIDGKELAAYVGEHYATVVPDSHIPDPRNRHRRGFRGGNEAVADLGPHGFSLDAPDRNARTINVVNSIILNALRMRASDIHIEKFLDAVAMRVRVDGILQDLNGLEKSRTDEVISRIKVMAGLNIMERRVPQEGRCHVLVGEDRVDVRVSAIPIESGESIVLRLLSEAVKFPEPSTLGFSSSMTRALKSVVQATHGLYLFTGPTGSGKTTTLHSVLRSMDIHRKKIITIEDPVEYTLDGIAQIPANPPLGLTYEVLLKRVLRQDPNVIMIGEIRDQSTADAAVRAALSGHLILSTVHTDRASDAFHRLVNIGVPRYLLSSVLRAVFTQRLVRRLCPACRAETRPDSGERLLFERAGLRVLRVARPVGCEACRGTGYVGRFGIGEFFEAASNADSDASPVPSVSIIRDGLARVAEGRTSFAEIYREATP